MAIFTGAKSAACSLPRRAIPALALAALLGAFVAVVSADNTDPNNNGSRYAWGENVGWISARPSSELYGPGGSGMQVSDTDVTGYLWGENIGWINLSCLNDASCGGAAGNWGVKNSGGVLSGYAWSENAGWISFSCQNNPSTCASAGNYGVVINNYTVHYPHKQAGVLSGYAWGENIGWISFNCSNDASCGTVQYQVQTGAPDSDGDGYTDAQETALSKDPFTYCPTMRADYNGDNVVNGLDLGSLALVFTQSVPPADARRDINGDNVVNGLDLGSMALVFTKNVSQCP